MPYPKTGNNARLTPRGPDVVYVQHAPVPPATADPPKTKAKPQKREEQRKAEGKRAEVQPKRRLRDEDEDEDEPGPGPVGNTKGKQRVVDPSTRKGPVGAKPKGIEERQAEEGSPEVVEVKPPPGYRVPKPTSTMRQRPCKHCKRLGRVCADQVGGKACVECAKVKMRCEADDEDHPPVAFKRPALTGARPPKRKKMQTSDEEEEEQAPAPPPRPAASHSRQPPKFKSAKVVMSSSEEQPLRTFAELEEENSKSTILPLYTNLTNLLLEALWGKVEKLEGQVNKLQEQTRMMFLQDSNHTHQAQLNNQQAELGSSARSFQKLKAKVRLMEREAGEVSGRQVK
jgi:hypothetical protein